MSLYAIGDLHLSFSVNKPMSVFGPVWHNHPEKLQSGFSSLTPDDTCILCGDLSWGMNLEESLADFAFIHNLPGKKIILKGNHDYWWTTASKIQKCFDANLFQDLSILHNNFIPYGDYAICGTRGWFYEEETGSPHDKKLLDREVLRLQTSLSAAGDRKKLVFLHYPPITKTYHCEEILSLLKSFNVRLCCYGHLHAKSCTFAYNGWHDGTYFRLVSADYLNFTPLNLDSFLYS